MPNYYEYNQNNSGRSWAKGMPHVLIVEASSSEEADQIAIQKGVYFNGVEQGFDCGCCGDRWSQAIELSLPMEWDKNTSVKNIHEYVAKIKETYDRNILVIEKP